MGKPVQAQDWNAAFDTVAIPTFWTATTCQLYTLRAVPGKAASRAMRATSAQQWALFTHDDGTPFSEGQLDEALRRILAARLPPDTIRIYSWHSMRIFLATMLLESGASFAQIRALCRWQTDDSILIYARLNSLKYKTLLDNAMRANVITARANNLAAAVPFIDACRDVVPGVLGVSSPDRGCRTRSYARILLCVWTRGVYSNQHLNTHTFFSVASRARVKRNGH